MTFCIEAKRRAAATAAAVTAAAAAAAAVTAAAAAAATAAAVAKFKPSNFIVRLRMRVDKKRNVALSVSRVMRWPPIRAVDCRAAESLAD